MAYIMRAQTIATMFMVTTLSLVAGDKDQPRKLDVNRVFSEGAYQGTPLLFYKGEQQIDDGAYAYESSKGLSGIGTGTIVFKRVQKKDEACCGIQLTTGGNHITFKQVSRSDIEPSEHENRVRSEAESKLAHDQQLDIVWEKSEIRLTNTARVIGSGFALAALALLGARVLQESCS